MENRNWLTVDVETTLATGKAGREAAKGMVARSAKPGATRHPGNAVIIKKRKLVEELIG